MPKPRPKGIDSPVSKFIIKWMSRGQTALYRATNGKIAGSFLEGAPVALVTTIGRKSGEPRVVPLLFLREGQRIVLVASQGGSDEAPTVVPEPQRQPQGEGPDQETRCSN